MRTIKNILAAWFKLKAWQQIFVALIAGIVAGLLLGKDAIIFKPIGVIFIHAIHMMVVPVVFTAIVCAVLAAKDSARMGRVWAKAMFVYFVSMLIASCIGILMAILIEPGKGLDISALKLATKAPAAVPTFLYRLINIVPENPIKAFTEGNILQILVFALLLGLSINFAGDPAKPIADLFKSFLQVVFKLATIIMSFAPYGIFSLLAWVFGEFGLQALVPLLSLVGTVYLSCILLIVIYYFGVLLLFRVNPIKFFKGSLSAIVLAFTTSSSAATLPQTLRCAEENLKIKKSTAGFLLPLGATLNLNGLCIYISAATIFAADIFGVHLHMAQYLTIVLTTVLSAMGAAAVPGSALIVMGAVMSSVGVSLAAMPLIAGVDRLNDMMQTATNVTGDLFAATIVSETENEIEEASSV